MTPEDQQVRQEEELAEHELRSATASAQAADRQQLAAKARLDTVLQKTKDILSRRRAAAIAGLTPGRVQQIIDGKTPEIPPASPSEPVVPPHVGELLRARRHELGWSIGDAAAKLAVRPETLSRMEKGAKLPHSKAATAYIELLGGSLNVVFSTASPDSARLKRAKEIANDISEPPRIVGRRVRRDRA